MTDNTETPYPSIRQALFGNGHAANIRCGCKWLAWQLYWLSVVCLVYPIVWVVDKIPLTADPIRSGFDRVSGSDWGFYLWGVAMIVSLTWAAYVLATELWQYYVEYGLVMLLGGFGVAIALLVGFIVIGFVVDTVLEWLGDNETVGSTTGTQKPLLRRIYGYCPVDLTLRPKWVRRLTE